MISAYFSQFDIIRLLDCGDLGVFTNSSLMIVFPAFGLIWILSRAQLVPRRWQILMELIHSNIRGLVGENHGLTVRYFPFIYSLFIFLVFINLTGLCPYVFTPTAHIVLTLGTAVSLMLSVTLLGMCRFRTSYLSILVPSGVPLAIGPFLVIVETASYFIRALSLGIRLAANISAGHLLFAILASFAFSLCLHGFIILGALAIVVLMLITVLEVMVAIIQAYVYVLLVTIYLKDTMALH